MPLVAGWLVVRFVGPSLARPAGPIGAVVWFAQAIVLATPVAHLVERATRRFLPLVALLGMSLSFPDQAPSRFAVALRSGTVRQLANRIEEVNKNGLSDEVQVAAAQAVELVSLLARHERHARGHTERVRAYAELVAAELGLSMADRQKLAWAALLHDIGKLSVPPEILNKDGAPDAAEWKILQGHPAAGEAFVEPLASWLGEWRLATSQHHERWDGEGYPAGLRGSNISLAGRIVAVADSYDVITARRSYKQSMSPEAARRELVECAGKQFDPDVVRAMLVVSVGSKRSSAWFSWLFELPRLSSLVSGVTARSSADSGSGCEHVDCSVGSSCVLSDSWP
jgi:hypothetical protein